MVTFGAQAKLPVSFQSRKVQIKTSLLFMFIHNKAVMGTFTPRTSYNSDFCP